MSAAGHVNPNQLRMLMTPQEVMDEAFPGDYTPLADDENLGTKGLWDYKLHESKGPEGVLPSIAAHGVETPIILRHGVNHFDDAGKMVEGGTIINDGHHRLISAATARPEQYIPVLHTDTKNWHYWQDPRDTSSHGW